MKVLILGAGGQLGWEMARTRPEHVEMTAWDYPEVDFTTEASIRDCVEHSRADWIVNAAAYTAVDKAEDESASAFQINCEAVNVLAGLCRARGIGLAHISTDFVFSGQAYRPWKPEDRADPVSVYGRSKRGGEIAVQKVLGQKALMIRTAWLYSSHGQNFVKTMLRLMAERDFLQVVDDQIGTPTWAGGLAKAVWVCLDKDIRGIHHWTDAGVASWYDFAVAIQEEALELGLLEEEILIMPVGTMEYPTRAKRPGYSVLDKKSMKDATGLEPMHWRKKLRQMLGEMVS